MWCTMAESLGWDAMKVRRRRGCVVGMVWSVWGFGNARATPSRQADTSERRSLKACSLDCLF